MLRRQIVAAAVAAATVAWAPPASADDDPDAKDRAAARIEAVRDAEGPAEAVEAYFKATAAGGPSVELHKAYLRRMVDFGLPDLLRYQAQVVLAHEPDNGLAWAVTAFNAAQRGETVEAFDSIRKALKHAPEEAFALNLAGQLVAWYDHQTTTAGLPREVRDAVAGMREDLGEKEAFVAGRREATEALLAGASAAGAPAEADEEAVEVVEPAYTYESYVYPSTTRYVVTYPRVLFFRPRHFAGLRLHRPHRRHPRRRLFFHRPLFARRGRRPKAHARGGRIGAVRRRLLRGRVLGPRRDGSKAASPRAGGLPRRRRAGADARRSRVVPPSVPRAGHRQPSADRPDGPAARRPRRRSTARPTPRRRGLTIRSARPLRFFGPLRSLRSGRGGISGRILNRSRVRSFRSRWPGARTPRIRRPRIPGRSLRSFRRGIGRRRVTRPSLRRFRRSRRGVRIRRRR